MTLFRISSTSPEGIYVPTDERFLDVGRLVVHMMAETNNAAFLPCEEGGVYLLPRREQSLFYAWPPVRDHMYCGPDRANSDNMQPVLHVGRGSSADVGVVYFFNDEGDDVHAFLDNDGHPRRQFERTLFVSPDAYRGFSVGSMDAEGRVALHEMVVSLALSHSLVCALEKGVRAEA